MSTITSDRLAVTSHPLTGVLAERWSPRSFDATAELSDAQALALLEAARWAPSAGNGQPRRFILARRGTAEFDAIVATLAEGNRPWAVRASALVVAIIVAADDAGKPNRWADYDLGQSVAHLAVQAHAEGLHTHQMGGFDATATAAAFGLDAGLVPTSITAIGTLAPVSELEERFQARETAARSRKPLDEIVLVNV